MTSIHRVRRKSYRNLHSVVSISILILLASTALCGSSAWARVYLTGGLRGGVTEDPDSGFFGGHLAIYPGGIPLRFEPSLELGFGDEFFSLRGNGNFKYMFKTSRRYPIYLYPIFGLSMYYLNLDNCDADNCSDTKLGVNLGAGVQLWGFLFDLSVGLGSEIYPDFTFTLGYTF